MTVTRAEQRTQDSNKELTCTVCGRLVGVPYWLNPWRKPSGGRLMCQGCWDSLHPAPSPGDNVPPFEEN